MGNLNPLKYCFRGKHSKPRATFRILPGAENTREMCADCYEKLRAAMERNKGKGTVLAALARGLGQNASKARRG